MRIAFKMCCQNPIGTTSSTTFICTAGQMNYDDPILYPGVKGGSPHLHQWYGNTAGNYASTVFRDLDPNEG